MIGAAVRCFRARLALCDAHSSKQQASGSFGSTPPVCVAAFATATDVVARRERGSGKDRDPRQGGRITGAALFGRRGWEVDRLVFMVRRRDADRASVAPVQGGFDPVSRSWQFTMPPEGESYR